MKYQYKIIGFIDEFNNQRTFYKLETEQPYYFNVGDEIWFPEDWKEDQGGGYTWVIRKIQHYVVDNFVAVYVAKQD